ncbi:MAG: hypothetical protein ABW002_02625, partial [Xanthomonas sp.]
SYGTRYARSDPAKARSSKVKEAAAAAACMATATMASGGNERDRNAAPPHVIAQAEAAEA